MLKFGQVINLEALEKKSVNKPADELREKLAILEKKQKQELDELEVFVCCFLIFPQATVQNLKDELLEVTTLNTKLLNSLARNTGRQYSLDSTLDLSHQNVLLKYSFIKVLQIIEYTGSQKREEAEERKLMEIAKEQAERIIKARQEINFLRGKGMLKFTH